MEDISSQIAVQFHRLMWFQQKHKAREAHVTDNDWQPVMLNVCEAPPVGLSAAAGGGGLLCFTHTCGHRARISSHTRCQQYQQLRGCNCDWQDLYFSVMDKKKSRNNFN